MEDPLVWWTGQSDASITQGLPHPFIGTLTLLVSHVAHAEVFASEVRKLLVSKFLEYSKERNTTTTIFIYLLLTPSFVTFSRLY